MTTFQQRMVSFVISCGIQNMISKDLQDLLDLQEYLDKINGSAPVKMLWMWWST